MGLQYGSIRTAATALLVAAAVGTGGMAGMTSALAANPATVGLTGTIVDGNGAPLAGVPRRGLRHDRDAAERCEWPRPPGDHPTAD